MGKDPKPKTPAKAKPKKPSAYDKALTDQEAEIKDLKKRMTWLEGEVHKIRTCRGIK